MNSKKKIVVAISAFALIIMATIVSVVAVLAAQKVTITSSVSVSYTSVEVDGAFTAHYQVKNGTKTSIGSATFQAEDSGTEADPLLRDAGTANGITLTSANNHVDFIFTFTNTGSAAYTATVTLPTTSSGLTVSYPTKPSTMVSGSNTSFTVAGKTTTPVTYTVRYTISDVAINASLSGNFVWNLT